MMRALRYFGLAAGLAIFAGAALADEVSDYVTAAGDEVDALGKCTGTYANVHISSTESPEQIADDAFRECASKAVAVRMALMGDPTHLSNEKASEVVAEIVARSKASLIEDIKKAR